jgi:hypothetical protein
MKFGDLKSGHVVRLMGMRSVILAIETPHPLNPSFLLIVWYIFDEKRLSFDMLHPDYELLPGTDVSQDGMYSYRKAMNEMSHNR